MSERQLRRRRRTHAGTLGVRVESDALESQGAGTWLELPRALQVDRHLEPIMRLQRWQSDPRMATAQESNDATTLLALLDEMQADFARVLAPAVRAWNWVTDMEAEIADLFEDRICLATPIWAGTPYDSEPYPELAGCVAWVGNFPEATRLPIVAVEDAGQTLVIQDGEQIPPLTPGVDWVLIGYPDPGSGPLDWCSLEELTFIGQELTRQFNAVQQSRSVRPNGGKRR